MSRNLRTLEKHKLLLDQYMCSHWNIMVARRLLAWMATSLAKSQLPMNQMHRENEFELGNANLGSNITTKHIYRNSLFYNISF